jgi:CHAT domain-containing protein
MRALVMLATASVALAGCALRSGARAEAERSEERLRARLAAGSPDAEASLERAVAASERAHRGDPLAVADSLDRFAEAFAALAPSTPNGLAAVESLRRRALEVRERALPPGDPRLGEALSLLSTACYDQGRWGPAEEYERRALAVFEAALGPHHVRVAGSLSELATVLFQEGRYQEASALQDRSLAIFEAATPRLPVETARALNVVLELRRVQGRYEESEASGRRAVALLRAGDTVDGGLLADVLNNLAGLYKDQGRYDEAEAALREVIDTMRRQPAENASALTTAQANQADVLRLQGRLDEAEPLFREALETARGQLAGSDPFLATFLNRAALVAVERGDLEAAEPLYREALALLERTSPGHPDLAQTLHDFGGLRAAQERCADALDLYGRALRLREAIFGPSHGEVALTLTEMARCRYAEGPAADAEAADLLERAVSILSANRIYPEALADALALQALVRRRRGDADGALRAMGEALGVIEELRPRRGGSEATRAEFAARHAAHFHQMATWQLGAGRLAEALRSVERGRARVLLDQLALARVDLDQGVPEAIRLPLARRKREAQARLAEAQARLTFNEARNDLPASARAAEASRLATDADGAARELQQAAAELRRASPVWRDLVTAGGRVASVDEVRNELLLPDRLLLLYSVGPRDSHVIVVPGEGAAGHRTLAVAAEDSGLLGVPAGPLTEGSLDRVLGGDRRSAGLGHALARSRGLARVAAEDEPSAPPLEARLAALFRTLVPEDVWPAIRGASEVLIVPDGALHRLPFEALVVGQSQGGGPSYWLDEGPVVRYAPSATTACNLARAERDAGRAEASSALVVAKSSFSGGPDGPTPAPSRAGRARAALAPLPGTAAEAAEVEEALERQGTQVVVLAEAEAREPAVRSAVRARRHRYLHFATHGLVEEGRSELLAALALTPPPAAVGTPDDDGLLQLFEIYELDARSDLVVLSACDSHAGRQVKGEGVFALSRAFLAAGARRVVASLWPVDDASTAALMGAFYRRLARLGTTRPDYARALRDARREVRATPRWSMPYYWAPFVISGAPGEQAPAPAQRLREPGGGS